MAQEHEVVQRRRRKIMPKPIDYERARVTKLESEVRRLIELLKEHKIDPDGSAKPAQGSRSARQASG